MQHISELLILFAAGVGASILCAGLIVQNVGNSLLERAGESSVSDINEHMNVSGDADSSTLTKTIDHLAVSISGIDIMQLVLIGIAVIAVAVFISSLPMFKTKPKKLLSEFE